MATPDGETHLPVVGAGARGTDDAPRERRRERCILLGVDWPGAGGWPLEQDMEELADLAAAAGADVATGIVQRRPAPDPATLVGKGKVQEAVEAAALAGARTLICNRDLSPRQLRNWSRVCDLKVLDRTQLILDIFALRARTREARLQVELAQLSYLLPRLGGAGRSLSRTGGGIGTRGPGETQLETDRRRLRARIAWLEREIAAVRLDRRTQRGARLAAGLPVVALVGYTNAGKSTLMNALTGAGAWAADALFATLDPSTRLLRLPGGRQALLSDTVGFVHDLPHHLIAAFRATLEQVAEAAVVVHVVDVSHPLQREHQDAVAAVLAELGVTARPQVVAFNKSDRLAGTAVDAAGGVAVSARTGEGLPRLLAAIAERLVAESERVRATLPYGTGGALLDLLHRRARVHAVRYLETGIEVEADCSPEIAARLRSAALDAGDDARRRPP